MNNINQAYNSNEVEPFEYPNSNKREIIHEVFQSRTLAQFETVRRIVAQSEFDFAVSPGPIFTPDVVPYTGPFVFLWYRKDGALMLDRINTRGKIMHRIGSTVDANGVAHTVVDEENVSI